MKKIFIGLLALGSLSVFAQTKVIEEIECKNEKILLVAKLIDNLETGKKSILATVNFLRIKDSNPQTLLNTDVKYSSFREVRNLVLKQLPQSNVYDPRSTEVLMTLETTDGADYSSFLALHSFVHELKCLSSSDS